MECGYLNKKCLSQVQAFEPLVPVSRIVWGKFLRLGLAGGSISLGLVFEDLYTHTTSSFLSLYFVFDLEDMTSQSLAPATISAACCHAFHYDDCYTSGTEIQNDLFYKLLLVMVSLLQKSSQHTRSLQPKAVQSSFSFVGSQCGFLSSTIIFRNSAKVAKLNQMMEKSFRLQQRADWEVGPACHSNKMSSRNTKALWECSIQGL